MGDKKIDWSECPVGVEVSTKLASIHCLVKEIKTDVKKQNSRVDKLENWRWFLTGIAVGIPFLINFVLRIIGKGF